VCPAYQFLQSVELLLLRCERRPLLSGLIFLMLDLLLLTLDLFLLLTNLRLLFLDGIDQDDADAVVLDSLDLAVSVRTSSGATFSTSSAPRPKSLRECSDARRTQCGASCRPALSQGFS